MPYEDAWTGRFVEKALREHNGAEDVERVGTNRIRVVRKHGRATVDILTVDIAELDVQDVAQLIEDAPGVAGIVNVRSDSRYTGPAKTFAETHGCGLFTMRELMGAVNAIDFAAYERSSLEYVKRALPQHSNVIRVDQVDQEQLEVVRDELSPVRFVTADIYVLGVADVRDLLARFPGVHAIVKTNPNGEYSDEAKEAARSAGVGLFTFREFMGALNFDDRRFLEYRPMRDR